MQAARVFLRRLWILPVLCLVVLGAAPQVGRPEKSAPENRKAAPAAAKKGLDQEGRLRVSEADRCPVCAMRVSRHPKFACAMELADGRTYYFCGAGCLIRTWLHPEAFLGVGRDRVQRVVVQDYFTGRPVDARTVIWVYGSDVVGPMGPAFVPLKDGTDLRVFRRRHGGDGTFRLGEMTDAKWKNITGKKAAP